MTLCEVNMVDVDDVEFIYEVNEKGTPAFKLIDRQKIHDGIIKRIKSGSMAKVVIDSEITMHHAYFGFDGDVLGEFKIDKYDLTGQQRPEGTSSDAQSDDSASDDSKIKSTSNVRRQIELDNRFEEIELAVYAFRDGMTVEEWKNANGIVDEPVAEVIVENEVTEMSDSAEEPIETDDETTEPAIDRDDQVADDIVENEEQPEPEPELPQAVQFGKTQKSGSNPAGIQSNPFFQ